MSVGIKQKTIPRSSVRLMTQERGIVFYVWKYEEKALAYCNADIDVRRLNRYRYEVPGRFSVNGNGSRAFQTARFVFNIYMIGRSPELAHAAERIDICRQTRVYAQSVKLRSYSQNVLADGYK